MTAVIWRWALNGESGYVNAALEGLGAMRGPVIWLAEARTAFPVEILIGILVSIPFTTTLFLGGLSSLPRDIYEAAEVDGATRLQAFRRLTLPLMRPFVTIATVINVINVFNSFPIIWVLTQGGPANSTDILVTYLYKLAFRFGRLGDAAALSLIMFAILFAFTLIYVRLADEIRAVSLMRRGSASSRYLRRSFLSWLVLSPLVVVTLFPFAVMLATALKPASEILTPHAEWLGTRLAFENFASMWEATHFGRALWNSLMVSTATTIGAIALVAAGRLQPVAPRAQGRALSAPIPARDADAVADRAGDRPLPPAREPGLRRQSRRGELRLCGLQHRLLGVDAAELFRRPYRASSRRRPGSTAPRGFTTLAPHLHAARGAGAHRHGDLHLHPGLERVRPRPHPAAPGGELHPDHPDLLARRRALRRSNGTM